MKFLIGLINTAAGYADNPVSNGSLAWELQQIWFAIKRRFRK